MTREDQERAAAIAAIRERAGLAAAAGQERGRCRECKRPVRFEQVLCERCALLNVRRVK